MGHGLSGPSVEYTTDFKDMQKQADYRMAPPLPANKTANIKGRLQRQTQSRRTTECILQTISLCYLQLISAHPSDDGRIEATQAAGSQIPMQTDMHTFTQTTDAQRYIDQTIKITRSVSHQAIVTTILATPAVYQNLEIKWLKIPIVWPNYASRKWGIATIERRLTSRHWHGDNKISCHTS